DEIALGSTKLKFLDEMVLLQIAREEADRKKKEEEEAERATAEAQAREAQEAEEEEEEDEESEEEAEDESGATDSREPTAPMSVKQGLLSFLPERRTVAAIAGGIVLLGVLSVYLGTRKEPPPPVRPEDELARKEYNWAHLAFDEERYQ